jgi:hypothetical protein
MCSGGVGASRYCRWMTNSGGVAIAGRMLTVGECIDRLIRYPSLLISRYDRPGPGAPQGLTRAEIVRIRALSSRIDGVEVAWFLDRAKDAPWPLPAADLRDADPIAVGGLYDQLENFYRYFIDAAPRSITTAKISKVLHLKRPAAYPILDQRIISIYREAAAQSARRYPQRGHKRAYWAAIRDDLITNTESGALSKVRDAVLVLPAVGRKLSLVTDLRLLDLLTRGEHPRHRPTATDNPDPDERSAPGIGRG